MSRMSPISPRSVPDPAGDDYDRMMSRWLADRRALDAEQDGPAAEAEAEATDPDPWLAGGDPYLYAMTGGNWRAIEDVQHSPSVGQPSTAESFIPLWGSGRALLADLHDRDYPEFGFDLAALFADGGVGASAVKGWLKGAIKTKGPYVWRTRPSLNDVKNGVMDVSTWMRQTRNGLRHLEPGQPGHHWAIPQNGWGKIVPNSIKNQPWNIKAMPDKVVHGRIHGKYTHEGKELPRFNMLERLHYGVPDWPKLLAGSYLSRTMDQLLHHLPVSKSGSQTNAGRTTAPTPAPPIVAAPRR